MSNRSHKNLEVWKKAVELVLDIYNVTRDFPIEERFGLVSQMRRSAVSVPANIAEGAARHNRREYIQFLYIARGSLSEIETYLEICLKLDFLTEEKKNELNRKVIVINIMLAGLIRKLKSLELSRA